MQTQTAVHCDYEHATLYKGSNIITVLCRWRGYSHKRHVGLLDTWTHFESSRIVYVQRRWLPSVTVKRCAKNVCKYSSFHEATYRRLQETARLPETSRCNDQLTQFHIPDERNPQLHCCETPKFCTADCNVKRSRKQKHIAGLCAKMCLHQRDTTPPRLQNKRGCKFRTKNSHVCYLIMKYYVLNYSMVHSLSWEANWFAASQEIPHISQNPKVHYRTHKRPPLVSILGQPNPFHIPISHLLEIRPNIIHPSTPRSSQFLQQDPIHSPLLSHMRHMPSP